MALKHFSCAPFDWLDKIVRTRVYKMWGVQMARRRSRVIIMIMIMIIIVVFVSHNNFHLVRIRCPGKDKAILTSVNDDSI